jgi:hypothetical protein
MTCTRWCGQEARTGGKIEYAFSLAGPRPGLKECLCRLDDRQEIGEKRHYRVAVAFPQVHREEVAGAMNREGPSLAEQVMAVATRSRNGTVNGTVDCVIHRPVSKA